MREGMPSQVEYDTRNDSENLCRTCGHGRCSHLDTPYTKNGPKVSDRGWCTRPEGSCIFHPCDCKKFEEPEIGREESDMPRFEEIQLSVGIEEREVRLLFSQAVKEVCMTANEAEQHAYEMLDAVKAIRKNETRSGIDTGNILPSR